MLTSKHLHSLLIHWFVALELYVYRASLETREKSLPAFTTGCKATFMGETGISATRISQWGGRLVAASDANIELSARLHDIDSLQKVISYITKECHSAEIR
jgi:hypothetical protein